MCLKNLCVLFLLLSVTGLCVAGTSVVPTTTLAAQTANNTSAANTFVSQTNGNSTPGNVSKVDVHTLLYPGATSKVYAHLLVWFGGSNHMKVGYNSADAAQIHRQITDMVSRGIDGVIIDWYGPNNGIDTATKQVMAEAETHPGFTFAIMIDQGAIQWYSCPGCSPQAALIDELQYIERTYFSSPAYMKVEGRPVVTNFNVDLSYSVDWDLANAALSSQPLYIFQNNSGFSHVLTNGSYSWVMPTTHDYGIGYLTSFYGAGMSQPSQQTVGATYKGFNDSLASWGSNRVMGQQCGQTWLQTFSEVNHLYNSGKQLAALQLVTWNDYEEGTEIETGINNCLTVSASVSGTSLRWSVNGSESSIDHYVPFISTDGKNLMSLGEIAPGNASLNLCSYSFPDGNYTSYVQAVGKPSVLNQMSSSVKFSLKCQEDPPKNGSLSLGANPAAMTVTAGAPGQIRVTVTPQSGAFNNSVGLTCSGLPASLGCSFSPASVIPGASAVSSILTVQTISARAANRHERSTWWFATGLFSFGLFGITLVGKVDRRRLAIVAASLALTPLLLMGTSCDGNSLSAVKSSSSINRYVVTVNGASGSVQVSTTITVTVK